MSLKVFKADEATCDYENDFFREFASNLVSMFKAENLDGILIGHPDVPSNPYLKPDCVLITKNRLVLIDFKNYGGHMWLPDADHFNFAPWYCNENVLIKGGAAKNPFDQLKRQRKWVEELIGTDVYDKGGIACLVCFQDDMRIMNKVPGRYQRWFSVTNNHQYLNRIRDIIGVTNHHVVDIQKIASYFRAKPYTDYYTVNLKNLEEVNKANEIAVKAEQEKIEAEQEVTKLKAQIAAAASTKENTQKLQEKLEHAEATAQKAKQEAEKVQQDFDEKKHALDLETQKSIQAKEKTKRAVAEAKKSENDVRVSENKIKLAEAKARNRRLTFAFVIVIVAILIIAIAGATIVKQIETQRQADEAAAQLDEDYRNGRQCIPVEKIADFEGENDVCVDFYATYINDSDKYIFIDNGKNSTFALMISKNLISESDAKARYLNQHLKVRGSITKYENQYEIKVYNLSQIEIAE